VTYLAVFDAAHAGWTLPRRELIAALSRSWPDIRPTRGPVIDQARDVVWTFEDGDGKLEVYVNRSGTCLYIDGDLKGAMLVATWYRSLVPSAIDVVFCDDSYSFRASILPGMTSADLLEAVRAL